MNQVYTHPGQPQMQVEVILASKTENAPTLYTIRMRYPRIIHGEVMTHRMFSRNARSSRAVPVKTMLNEVQSIPFVPWHWGKNQKGMQAGEDHNELIDMGTGTGWHETLLTRESAWLSGAGEAAQLAQSFMNAGYHKQIPNRLLEPFSWIDTLVSTTDLDNFLWLRGHKDAEPHLQDLAVLVDQAISETQPKSLEFGDWHLPYIIPDDWAIAGPMEEYNIDILRKISAARCARISYKPFNGNSSFEAELDRYNLLVQSDRVHASPLEHQATPDEINYQGEYKAPQYHGNFTGWIQHRKLIPNECYKS